MYDEHYDEYKQDEMFEDFYEEFKEQAIEEFTAARLKSFYVDNPFLAKPAVESLSEGRNLMAANVTAGFLFSAIAIEVGLKSTLLKPIVCGLVHTSSIAELIAEMILSQTGVVRFRDLIVWILKEHGKVDLTDFKRPESNSTLWQEINEVQKIRNSVMHRAEKVSPEQANLSLGVGSFVLEKIFPAVLSEMELHLHDGFRICNSWRCRDPEIEGK